MPLKYVSILLFRLLRTVVKTLLGENLYGYLRQLHIIQQIRLRTSVVVSRDAVPAALTAAVMAFPGTRWHEARPGSLGMDADKFKIATNYLAQELITTGGVNELLIIRRGYVVAKGIDTGRMHNVWSVGKTFTSTVLALLIDDGKCTLATPCSEYEPLLKDHYSGVKLVHFATMTSGYDAVGFNARHAHGDGRGDWGPDPYSPDTPLFPPGTKFCYHDEAMFMLGRVLTRIAAETMHSILKRRITDEIGMGEWGWPTKGRSKAWIWIRGVAGWSYPPSSWPAGGTYFSTMGAGRAVNWSADPGSSRRLAVRHRLHWTS